jgi:hypothetical protein
VSEELTDSTAATSNEETAKASSRSITSLPYADLAVAALTGITNQYLRFVVLVMVLLLGELALGSILGFSDARFFFIGGVIFVLVVLGMFVRPPNAEPAVQPIPSTGPHAPAVTPPVQAPVSAPAPTPLSGPVAAPPAAPLSVQLSPGIGLSVEEQRGALNEELTQHQRTLSILRQQKAVFSAGSVPPHILTGIRIEEKEIERVSREIQQLVADRPGFPWTRATDRSS